MVNKQLTGGLRMLVLAVFFLHTAAAALAQKATEGVAEFVITYPGLSDEMKKNEDVLPKSMTIYFKQNRCRLELHTIMGNTVILSDDSVGETTVLMEMMGKKIAIRSTRNRSDSAGTADNTTTELIKGSKRIAGYDCKKARITTQMEGTSFTFECYYAEDLPNVSTFLNSKKSGSINGFMLEYEVLTNGIKMHMKADSVKLQANNDSWFAVPDGYEIISQQQLMEQMGAPSDSGK